MVVEESLETSDFEVQTVGSVAAPRRARTLPLAAAVLLTLVAGLAWVGSHGAPAEARGVWCSGDPAILVNGTLVDVNVNVPLDKLGSVQRAEVVFHVPSNAIVVVVNDSLLFPAKVTVVRDQPPTSLLAAGYKIPVEVNVVASGPAFDIAATVVAVGGGDLWIPGRSGEVTKVTTWVALGL